MSETPSATQMLGERTYDTGDDRDAPGAALTRDESIDTTPPTTPETFDSSAFLAGVRPTRRSVQIVERADLVSDMEQLQGAYIEADQADDDEACDKIAAAFEQVAAVFHGSKRWYTVEKRSGEWLNKLRDDLIKEHDLDLGDDKGEGGNPEHAKIATLHQLAAQIVSPTGTTYEDLEALYDHNEGELNKLVIAMTMANSQQATAAKVATPGFSLRRSERKDTRGSSKR